MKKISILTLFLFILCSILRADPLMTLENKTAQFGHPVTFPITGSGFPTNIGAITLNISIDTCVLHFDGFTQGTLPGAFANLVGSNVCIVWSNTNNLSINGIMLTLKFSYEGGSCNLNFQAGYEIVTIDFQPVTCGFVNGSVSSNGLSPVTYYVDQVVGSSGNGLSWATALKTIHEGTNKPLFAGDNVLVNPGTYTDTVIIKTNGLEILHPKRGVTVSDTNRITFPSNIGFCGIRLNEYPGKYYAYVYRSWKGNNGVYKITGVNESLHYITVSGAQFKPESGVVNDTASIQVSVAIPVIYQKDTADPVTQRVIIQPAPGVKAICYFGKPSTDWLSAIPANYNIINGFDVTGITSFNGVQITCSNNNVYMNSRVYELDTTGIFINGDSTRNANYNIIQNNIIYNTSGRACAIGRKNIIAKFNQAHFNHIIRNEIYSTTSAKMNFRSAITINQYNTYAVIEGNYLHDFNFKATNFGAIEVWNNTGDAIVYGNYLKNVSQTTSGWTNALIYIHKTIRDLYVFNNVMVDSLTQPDSLYAFRLEGTKHYNAHVAYNTIYNIRRGILFEDDGSTPVPTFGVTDNIIHINGKYFTNIGTTGRFTVSYNCYPITPTAGGQPYNVETGRQVGNPLFINTSFFASPNGFRLQPGSICIGHGLTISYIGADYPGLTRNSSNPTIGAFEQALTTCIWTGESSTSWFDYRNWNCKLVPLSSLNVIVPDRTNDPSIVIGSAVCKTITIKAGSVVHVTTPGTLTVSNP